MSRFEHAAGWLYARLLCLYPDAFRETFAAEMALVFRQTLADARQNGQWAVLVVLYREFRDLPFNLLYQHLKAKERNPMQWIKANPTRQLNFVRWLLRAASLLINAYLLPALFIALQSGNVYDDAKVYVMAMIAASLSLLIAWRWERQGGIITIGCGLLVGITALIYVWGRFFQVGDQSVFQLLLATLISGAWMLHYLLMGWMYIRLEKQGRLMQA